MTFRRTWVRFGVGFAVWCALCGAHAELTLSFERHVAGAAGYTPGAPIDIVVDVVSEGSGTLTAVGLEETLPPDWSYDSVVAGTVPAIAPSAGRTGLLEFAWFPLPAPPFSFTYRVNVPVEEIGTKEISGRLLYRVLDVANELTYTLDSTIPLAGSGGDTTPPQAVISTTPDPAEIATGGTVRFDASASSDESGIAEYAWDFDASGGFQIDAAGTSVDRVFAAPGIFTVTLRVTDNAGLSSEATVQVAVGVAAVHVSGRVTAPDETPIPGVRVAVLGGGGGETVTDESGDYVLTFERGWSGTLTPTRAGYTFEPPSRAYSGLDADAANENYTGLDAEGEGEGEGECTAAPAAPQNVAASVAGFLDRVRITWDASTDASEYRVYRDNGTTWEPVGNWVRRTSFDDTSTAGQTVAVSSGCFAPPTNQGRTFAYRVVARNDCGESPPSDARNGSILAGKASSAASIGVLPCFALLLLLVRTKRATRTEGAR